MTAKRFELKYINEQHISANLYDCRTFIASIGIGAELIVELLNSLNDENEQLKQFKDKVYSVIDKRINELENDYNKAVKSGMPSNSVYGEIELLEELKKELEE